MNQQDPDAGRETRPTEDRADASATEGGAAGGALLGTVVGGPLGGLAGAAIGSVAGGAADAADSPDDEPDFERTGQPGDERSHDLVDPRLGGHVGGSDPEHA
ncbi:MAG TPA: hypothetical protein VLA44_00685 [Clostridia bacterium]|nr:hypothetical protein [Clostridia bacterium]